MRDQENSGEAVIVGHSVDNPGALKLDARGVPPHLYVRTVRNATLGAPVRRLKGVPVSITAWEDGHPVDESRLYRNRVVPPEDDWQEPNDTIDEPAIYGGFLFDHFGHFLVETLARVWALRDTKRLIVWSAIRDRLLPWQKEVFGLLGIDTTRFLIAIQPKRFRELQIPTAGLVLGAWNDQNHVNAVAAYPFAPPAPDKRVWLSRSGLNPDKTRVIDEPELETMLASDGWILFRPETASVTDQLQMMSDASVIAGFDGSAFHTVLLGQNVKTRLIIIPRGTTPKVTPTHALITEAKNIDLTVLLVPIHLVDPARGRGSAKFKMESAKITFDKIREVVASGEMMQR